MTVEDFIQELQLILAANPDMKSAQVVQSRDAEGNGYSPVDELCVAKYLAENTYSGEVVHPDDVDDYEELIDVVCLWPVN